jgi:hypothetical protein
MLKPRAHSAKPSKTKPSHQQPFAPAKTCHAAHTKTPRYAVGHSKKGKVESDATYYHLFLVGNYLPVESQSDPSYCFGNWVGSEHIVRQVYSDKHYQRIPSTASHRQLLG